jgi:hypothetical protein
MPFSQQFDDVYRLGIKPACETAGAYCERVDEQIFSESIMDRIFNQIARADLLIVDFTGRNPNVFYETGYAHALGKTVILLASDIADIPFDLKHLSHIIYSGRIATVRHEVEKRVAWVLGNLHAAGRAKTAVEPLIKPQGREGAELSAAAPRVLPREQLFISYSHRDVKWLKRLQVHLRPLERDNLIRRWDDTMLDAGDTWREKIREAVAAAKVALLLVSADFIASEFVHTNELPPLLAAAEAEGALIMPLIVSPSRFEQIRNLSRFQAFNAPAKPLINMKRTQQEQLFVDVATRVADILSPNRAG